ncbi:MAG: hypothetical protein IPP82_13560 [Xanthomonadales bacterium]|nr:hypothetical protein [Xanthomonadales bacterium]
MLNIDPVSGNVSIDLSADFSCYPLTVSSIANGASLSINGQTTVGGGTTGQGTVNVQLNTGLSAITAGVTCVPDGFIGSNVLPTGWTANLCTNSCGATVTRSVDVQNTSSTLDGNITFKAKCTYQDQTNVNLSSVRANIQSTPAVTVLHGTAPPANYCQSVSELADPKGLTPAMRQSSVTVTNGTLPGTYVDPAYTSIFGFSSNTFPAGSGDTVGYGFPGTNKSTLSSKIDRDKYISLQFRAPLDATWNQRTGYFHMTSQQNIGLNVAIAPCPGQFDNDANFPLPGSTCVGEGEFQDITWKVAGTGLSCNLVPGKTYYLNLIHAPRANPSQSNCTSSGCTFQIRNGHNY